MEVCFIEKGKPGCLCFLNVGRLSMIFHSDMLVSEWNIAPICLLSLFSNVIVDAVEVTWFPKSTFAVDSIYSFYDSTPWIRMVRLCGGEQLFRSLLKCAKPWKLEDWKLNTSMFFQSVLSQVVFSPHFAAISGVELLIHQGFPDIFSHWLEHKGCTKSGKWSLVHKLR